MYRIDLGGTVVTESDERRRSLLVAGMAVLTVAIGAWFLLSGRSGSSNENLGPAEATGDLNGKYRCQRVGYVCSWNEADEAAITRTEDVFAQAQALVNQAESPEEAINTVSAFLQEQSDVVEIIPDDLLWTSVMWRIEGAPPSVVFTVLAAPLGEPEPYDGPNYDKETAAPVAETLLANYLPAGGPLVDKHALVVDPYAEKATNCEGLEDKNCFRTSKGRIEGAAIAAIMRRDDQINVDYRASAWLNPFAMPNLGGYDLVHVASHGASSCGESLDWFENGTFDPDKCYSVTGLSKVGAGGIAAQREAGDANAPPGVWFAGDMWVATGEFWASQLGSDGITYMSHCTSGDGQLARSGNFGSFIGWHSYARLSTASSAATTFWTLMVTEGVEFDVAVGQLAEQDLTNTYVGAIDGYKLTVVNANLVTGGLNLRARDVITTFIGAELSNGAHISIEDQVGDGSFDTIAEVVFVVEGVTTGSEAASAIRVLLDTNELSQQIKVSDGEVIKQGAKWATWRIVVEHFELGFDVSLADVASSKTHTWESRVSDGGTGYSAHLAKDVVLAGRIEVAGALGLFEELDQTIRPEGGRIEGNELVMSFQSDGGPVNGELHVDMVSDVAGTIGQWDMTLAGTYDGDGGLTGDFDATAFGGIAGISSGDQGSGEWLGTFDPAAGTVTGTIGGGGDQIPINLSMG